MHKDSGPDEDKENSSILTKAAESILKDAGKRDFFGRIINDARPTSAGKNPASVQATRKEDDGRVWVSFHEGFSNAVRKPITLKELIDSFEV